MTRAGRAPTLPCFAASVVANDGRCGAMLNIEKEMPRPPTSLAAQDWGIGDGGGQEVVAGEDRRRVEVGDQPGRGAIDADLPCCG